MGAYIIVTLIATITIVVLFSVQAKKKPKTVMDELNAMPEFRKMGELYKAMREMNEGVTDQDTIPNEYGEFGYDVTNPIPVNTIFGNRAYLGSLQTMDGVNVTYERIGYFCSPISEYPIDGYEIFAEGQKIAVLYLDPYNKKNSRKAPKNFKLLS
ncbi:MAG: hypothetical protein GX556_20715 [Fibrobacter sp.]|nr:hypothetical protein [Fibrobacter sp.]